MQYIHYFKFNTLVVRMPNQPESLSWPECLNTPDDMGTFKLHTKNSIIQ